MSKYLLLLFILTAFGCMTEEKLQERTRVQAETYVQKNKHKWSLKVLHKVDDAAFTVVHIKQQHYSDILNKRIKEQIKLESDESKIKSIKDRYMDQIGKIDKIQKEIYSFLKFTTTEKDFLYVEGRSYPHHYRDTFLAEFVPNTVYEISRTLNYKKKSYRRIPDPPYFLGASIPIHQERRMTVIGAENLALLNLTISLYESKKLRPADLAKFVNECHEAREDQMLKHMSKNFEDLDYRMPSLRFLICGSKHDFKNNVEKWNSENPQMKFNLVVFTPPGLM